MSVHHISSEVIIIISTRFSQIAYSLAGLMLVLPVFVFAQTPAAIPSSQEMIDKLKPVKSRTLRVEAVTPPASASSAVTGAQPVQAMAVQNPASVAEPKPSLIDLNI